MRAGDMTQEVGMYCSCRGPKFILRTMSNISELIVAPTLEHLMTFPGFRTYTNVYIFTHPHNQL